MRNPIPDGSILVLQRSNADADNTWLSMLPRSALTCVTSMAEASSVLSGGGIIGVIAHGRYESEQEMTPLGELVQRAQDIPVIAVSAGGNAESAVAALHAGISDYLVAPVTAEQVQKALERAGAGRSAVDAALADPQDPDESTHQILTQDPGMGSLLKTARRVADSDATVLILGESGTGKELMARYVHQASGVPDRPLVALNCAALPETLAESELFGHERGAFTGAISRKLGRFELAQGGTLILDEISEMPLPLQAKLLRALQERVIDRVGGRMPIPISVRVIAISNVDLRQAVAEGRFRKDLYYRINVIPLVLPPLRDRAGDIPVLAEHFMTHYSRRNRRQILGIAPAAMDALRRHPWDGNIRELENTIERAVLISIGDTILPEHLMLEPMGGESSPEAPAVRVGMTVRDMEQALIHQTLARVNDNRTAAAEMLGISIRTLRNKLKEFRDQEAA